MHNGDGVVIAAPSTSLLLESRSCICLPPWPDLARISSPFHPHSSDQWGCSNATSDNTCWKDNVSCLISHLLPHGNKTELLYWTLSAEPHSQKRPCLYKVYIFIAQRPSLAFQFVFCQVYFLSQCPCDGLLLPKTSHSMPIFSIRGQDLLCSFTGGSRRLLPITFLSGGTHQCLTLPLFLAFLRGSSCSCFSRLAPTRPGCTQHANMTNANI